MFRAEPSDSCAQNSQLMAKAKQDGTLLTLDQVRKLDLSDA
jgi:hypothetical protein